jgi:hypothetical protein
VSPSRLLRFGPFGFRGLTLTVVAVACFAGLSPGSLQAQEEFTIRELEGLFRGAEAAYEAAFETLSILTSQGDRNREAFALAQAAGDEDAMNAAVGENYRLSQPRRTAQDRVEEKAREVRDARERLLEAHRNYLEDLRLQTLDTLDPETQAQLDTFILDTGYRIQELRNLEDPQVVLEPLPDLDEETRDSPTDLRNKANMLDYKAGQWETELAYNQDQLEDLRREQDLLRWRRDFLADRGRFGDQPPTGPPGVQTVPQPGQAQPPGADSLGTEIVNLSVEERIQILEAFQEELTANIQIIRVRAQRLRRKAGGEWAW